MQWIYLSPHLDDVILSCGGLIWEQVHAGERVQVWTVCAGDAPAGELTPYARGLHARWQTGPQAVEERRQEDRLACERVGAGVRHFGLPDCIYRRLPGGRPVVMSDEELFQPLKEGEQPLVNWLSAEMKVLSAELGQGRLVSPLGMGGHMDHRLVRAASEQSGLPLCYYAEFPYVMLNHMDLRAWSQPDWEVYQRPVSAQGLEAWQEGAAAYRSQISTFWSSEAEMREKLAEYLKEFEGGYTLLCKPPVE